jgi:hypothetical protein
VVPSLRCLLQAVEGLETAHHLRESRVNEADGLGVVDRFGEGAMDEGVLDVELIHRLAPVDGQSQHNSNDSGLYDRVESLIVVHPRALGEPLKDPTNLVSVQRAFCLELVLEDPLAGHHISPWRLWYKSHVLLDNIASYSSIARCQWESASALQTEVETGDRAGEAAATKSCRWSTSMVTSAMRPHEVRAGASGPRRARLGALVLCAALAWASGLHLASAGTPVPHGAQQQSPGYLQKKKSRVASLEELYDWT